MDVEVGNIEAGIPIPRLHSKPLTAAQEQVLKLPVGGSFVVTVTMEEREQEHYSHSELKEYFFNTAAKLTTWARSKGMTLSCRQLSVNPLSVSHRIWRVS